ETSDETNGTESLIRARRISRAWWIGSGVLLVGSMVLAIGIGPVSIHPIALIQSALAHIPFLHVRSHLDPVQSAVLWQVRAPRVVMAALVGGMLAIAGSAYQGVFRNPLADPYLLGVAAGAGLGATIAIAYGPGSHQLVPVAAFAGGTFAVVLTYALGRSAGRARATGALVLAGVTVAAFLTAIQTFVQQQRTDTLRDVYSFLLGAVSIGGLIGFVGIIVPHTIRLLMSTSYRAVVPLSLAVGAGFLVLTDVISRTVLSPQELPIGVITAFLGAPFFAIVLKASRTIR